MFPAFLVLAARLQQNAGRLNPPENFFPVTYAPLDRPEAVTLQLPILNSENPESVLQRIKRYVADATVAELDRSDIERTLQTYGFFFGLRAIPDRAWANNVYGAALTLGRQKQMGIDSRRLAQDIESLGRQQLEAAARRFFGDVYGAAILQIQ
jgi:hypothetical protein